jgi:hypothetical protein
MEARGVPGLFIDPDNKNFISETPSRTWLFGFLFGYPFKPFKLLPVTDESRNASSRVSPNPAILVGYLRT